MDGGVQLLVSQHCFFAWQYHPLPFPVYPLPFPTKEEWWGSVDERKGRGGLEEHNPTFVTWMVAFFLLKGAACAMTLLRVGSAQTIF